MVWVLKVEEHEQTDPTWATIEAALDALDNARITYLSLRRARVTGTQTLLAMGGQRVYVQFETAEGQPVALLDIRQTEIFPILRINPPHSYLFHPTKCVDKELAKAAFQSFFTTDSPLMQLRWTEAERLKQYRTIYKHKDHSQREGLFVENQDEVIHAIETQIGRVAIPLSPFLVGSAGCFTGISLLLVGLGSLLALFWLEGSLITKNHIDSLVKVMLIGGGVLFAVLGLVTLRKAMRDIVVSHPDPNQLQRQSAMRHYEQLVKHGRYTDGIIRNIQHQHNQTLITYDVYYPNASQRRYYHTTTAILPLEWVGDFVTVLYLEFPRLVLLL